MVHIGLMFEGQDGLNWPRWKRLLQAAEDLGFPHVFRSDHFTNARPPDKDSLELWTSLTYAAAATQRIQFGSLVTPVTFRHPSITARVAAAVDDLSGGRLTLGIGAGWQDREHEKFGIPFPPAGTRFAMLREYLDVVTGLLRSDEPITYEGRHYQLHEAILLPRPQRPGGPRILVGGNGERWTMPIAAQYADEWNAIFVSHERLREMYARFDEILAAQGRTRDAVKRSLMLGTMFARNEQALKERLERRGLTVQDAIDRGLVVGTPDMWVEQLRAFKETGVERVMLQWLDQDDIEGLQIVAHDVVPAVG